MPGLQDADQAGSDRRTQFALLSEVPEVKQAADLCGFFSFIREDPRKSAAKFVPTPTS